MPVSEMKTDRHFDIASMWGVIEHLDNPAKEIGAAHKLLNDSGLLFIYTGDHSAPVPEFDSRKKKRRLAFGSNSQKLLAQRQEGDAD